jgi:4-hydroxybenzoate polyprenyltransferase
VNQTIQTHFTLARVSNLPTTWSNVLCALLLAGGFQWPAFAGALAAISLFYIGGMYLNDWRDADYDREHRAERPIPAGKISRKRVLAWALAYFALALGISVVLQPYSLLWTLGLVLCITAYDLDHKNNSMSPWIMAGCRALIYPWAASLTGQHVSVELWIACAGAYSYTLGLTYAARGAGKTAALRLLLIGCLFLPALLWGSRMSVPPPTLVWLSMLVFLAWTGYCISAWFYKSSTRGPSIGNLIAGFCFVDLLAISVASSIHFVILFLVALLFLGTLKFQKIISGT